MKTSDAASSKRLLGSAIDTYRNYDSFNIGSALIRGSISPHSCYNLKAGEVNFNSHVLPLERNHNFVAATYNPQAALQKIFHQPNENE
jgi:hypothetical protein